VSTLWGDFEGFGRDGRDGRDGGGVVGGGATEKIVYFFINKE
jgi:hypothetical protein